MFSDLFRCQLYDVSFCNNTKCQLAYVRIALITLQDGYVELAVLSRSHMCSLYQCD